MTILDTVNKLKSGEITSRSLVESLKATFEADKKSELPLNAFLEIFEDATAKAEACDKEIAEANAKGSLDKLFEEKPLL